MKRIIYISMLMLVLFAAGVAYSYSLQKTTLTMPCEDGYVYVKVASSTESLYACSSGFITITIRDRVQTSPVQ